MWPGVVCVTSEVCVAVFCRGAEHYANVRQQPGHTAKSGCSPDPINGQCTPTASSTSSFAIRVGTQCARVSCRALGDAFLPHASVVQNLIAKLAAAQTKGASAAARTVTSERRAYQYTVLPMRLQHTYLKKALGAGWSCWACSHSRM